MENTNFVIGRYNTREQAVVMKALRAEKGLCWAREISRAEYLRVLGQALAARYGAR